MQLEGIAERIGPGLLQALAKAALLRQGVVAQGLPFEALIDFAEGLLANHARAARGEFETVVALGADVARLLKGLEEVVQAVEVLGGFGAEHLLKQVTVDVAEVAAAFGVLHLADEVIEPLHLVHELHGRFEAQLLAAVEAILATLRAQEVHALHQPGEFAVQFRVVEAVLQETLQLRPLFGGKGIHERLGRGHLLAHLLEQFVEGGGRVVAEQVAELGHERLEAGILPGNPLDQHVVQRLKHALHPLHVAVGEPLDQVLHALEEAVGRRLA